MKLASGLVVATVLSASGVAAFASEAPSAVPSSPAPSTSAATTAPPEASPPTTAPDTTTTSSTTTTSTSTTSTSTTSTTTTIPDVANLELRLVSEFDDEEQYPRGSWVVEVGNRGPSVAHDVVVELDVEFAYVLEVIAPDFDCSGTLCRRPRMEAGTTDLITVRAVFAARCGWPSLAVRVTSSTPGPAGTADPNGFGNHTLRSPAALCSGGHSYSLSNTNPRPGGSFTVNFGCSAGDPVTLSFDGRNYRTTALVTGEAIFELVAPRTNGTYWAVYDGCRDEGSFTITVSGGLAPLTTATSTDDELTLPISGSGATMWIGVIAAALVLGGFAFRRLARRNGCG